MRPDDERKRGFSIPPGTELAGKYRVVRELGRGGVGLVVEVEHVRLRQRFAVKLLDPHYVGDTAMIERFEAEARAMATLKSPHVATVMDVDVLPDGTAYLVMELLNGSDLGAELRRRSVLPAAEIVEILIQACAGLEVIHAAHIVHRDLKPSNLFLANTETGVITKVMDFGISKFEGDEHTRTGSSLGTPAYMSPEQVRSARDVDTRADLWSMGVILFRALTGLLPFRGEGITGMSAAIVADAPKSIAEIRSDLPQGLIDIVIKLLEKERERRFQDATSLREALMEQLPSLEGLPTYLPPALPSHPSGPPSRSYPGSQSGSRAGTGSRSGRVSQSGATSGRQRVANPAGAQDQPAHAASNHGVIASKTPPPHEVARVPVVEVSLSSLASSGVEPPRRLNTRVAVLVGLFFTALVVGSAVFVTMRVMRSDPPAVIIQASTATEAATAPPPTANPPAPAAPSSTPEPTVAPIANPQTGSDPANAGRAQPTPGKPAASPAPVRPKPQHRPPAPATSSGALPNLL